MKLYPNIKKVDPSQSIKLDNFIRDRELTDIISGVKSGGGIVMKIKKLFTKRLLIFVIAVSLTMSAFSALSIARAEYSGESGESEWAIIMDFTFSFPDPVPVSLYNSALAASYINRTILEPGQAFSFNAIVGNTTAAKGYKYAPIIGGWAYGGGVCKTSTVLFQAARSAGLEILERHNHGGSGVNYATPGNDAAISIPYKDMKFRNNTSNRIRIAYEFIGNIGKVKLYKSCPVRIACISDDGTLSVKEGAFESDWAEEARDVRQVSLSENRIGQLSSSGKFWVKEGGLNAMWSWEADNISQISLSGNRIGQLENDGKFWVKEGPLNAEWSLEAENVTQISLSGNRIGIIKSDGTLWVKEGGLNAMWALEAGDASQISLSGNRIGQLEKDGKFWVKEGALNAEWSLVAGNAKQITLYASRIGQLENDGRFWVKEGSLNAEWALEAGNATKISMSESRIGYVKTDGTLWVKEGGLSSYWTLLKSSSRGITIQEGSSVLA